MSRTRLLAALSAVTIAAALAGCGDSEGGAGTSTTVAPVPAAPPPSTAPATGTEPSADPPAGVGDGQTADFSRLRTCLKRQGVELPAGGPGANGPPQIDPAALRACAKYLPQGGPPGVTP